MPLDKHSMPPELIPRRGIQEKQPTSENDKWDDYTTGVFLEVCVEEIAARNRPYAYFNEEEWNNVIAKFNEKTGHNYDCRKLKNKWDILKSDFTLWAKLVENRTGLEWDPLKRTINAPLEFWEARRKVCFLC